MVVAAELCYRPNRSRQRKQAEIIVSWAFSLSECGVPRRLKESTVGRSAVKRLEPRLAVFQRRRNSPQAM